MNDYNFKIADNLSFINIFLLFYFGLWIPDQQKDHLLFAGAAFLNRSKFVDLFG
jgi:hypothetical protein